MRVRHFILLVVAGLPLLAPIARADALDDYIVLQMQRRQIPGLSLCVFDDGKVVRARGYGVVERGQSTPVTPDTLFEAGSISKPVTALAALVLVDEGRLSLDEDVNAKLVTWKVPTSDFTKQSKVTLRNLLSHSSGMSGATFDGYRFDEPLPSLVQILNGEAPAKSPPIRVESIPGAQWNYSSGGYLVVQQLLMDVSGKPFPDLMQATVLAPLGMTSSTFRQPLPADRRNSAATGHGEDRTPVLGRWHIYPEMAAGGLWTTACDLARFAMGVQRSVAGSSTGVLLQPMARQMVTRQKQDSGLGVFVDGKEGSSRFFHQGRDEGFDSTLVAYVETGKGVAVMLNANDDSRLVPRILRRAGELYHWPDFPQPAHRNEASATAVEPSLLAKYEGRYQLGADDVITFAARNGRLFTQSGGMDDEEFLPETPTRFVSMDRDAEVSFESSTDGSIVGLRWKYNGAERGAPRLGQ